MLDRARAAIDMSLAKLVEKNKLRAEDRDAALARIATTTSLDRLSDAGASASSCAVNIPAERLVYSFWRNALWYPHCAWYCSLP